MGRQEKLTLRIPARPESLALVRAIVTQMAEDAGLPEQEVGKVEIAVDEACTNILEHGYRGLEVKQPEIELQIARDDSALRVQIFDRARPFDMTTYSVPTFPDHWHDGHTRGVGIYLIRRCMDEINYRRLQDDRNMLELVKYLAPAAGGTT